MTATINSQDQMKALATEFSTADATRKTEIQKEIVNIVAEMLKPEATELVELCENGIETTKGNYGKYMQFLSGLKGIQFVGMVKALRNAGAGQGLDSAIQIIKGY